MKENKKINLVLTSDEKYIKLLVPCIISILSNKKEDTEIDIYILEKGINEYHKKRIKELETYNNTKNCKIDFLNLRYFSSNLNYKHCENTKIEKTYNYESSVLFIILIPNLFKHLQKVLFLDIDTIVTGDLLKLYNKVFEDNYIVCLKHDFTEEYINEMVVYSGKSYIYKDILIQIGYPKSAFNKGSNYDINSGVVLFNIEKIIKDKKDKDLMEITQKYRHILLKTDQDILVSVFKDQIKPLTEIYNFITIGYDSYLLLNKKDRQTYLNKLNKSIILHFLGNNKPINFHKLYKLIPKAYKIFYKYYQKSYLRINPIKLKLIFLISDIKRLRRYIIGIKKERNGKKVFYFFNIEIVLSKGIYKV